MAKVVTKSLNLARFFFVPSLRNSREMVGCEAKGLPSPSPPIPAFIESTGRMAASWRKRRISRWRILPCAKSSKTDCKSSSKRCVMRPGMRESLRTAARRAVRPVSMKSDRSRRTPASEVNFSEWCPVTFIDLLKGAVNTCPAELEAMGFTLSVFMVRYSNRKSYYDVPV